MTAFNTPLADTSFRNVGHNDVDTIDTAQLSESDSLLQNLDSIKALFDREHGIAQKSNTSRATQWNDSIAAVEDSIQKSKKKSALDAPVAYEAKDSMTFFMDTRNAFLYGDADVKYQQIDLKSENIKMNMDSSIVYAVGALDSVGKKFGTPIFKDGGDEYKMEEMSYNFKTKKGYITNIYTAQQDGFLTSEEAKKGDDGAYYMRGGTYTTCDEEHPHFYIRMA